MAGDSTVSPQFVRAKNEDELRAKLLNLQVSTGKQFFYLSIYRTPEGVVAWFLEQQSDAILNQLMGAIRG